MNALDKRDVPYFAQLQIIGNVIGYGRAQQILGILWDEAHNAVPRGSMGVTVKDKRPGHNKGKKVQANGRLA